MFLHLWLKAFSTFRINSGSISITRKIFGSGKTIPSDEKMNDIIKIVKSIENSSLLIIDVSETIKNRAKEKGGFLGMLLDTLGASFLGNMFVWKVALRASEETIRASQEF